MKNELQKHKKSDKIKWILTLVAFALVFVFLIGLCMQLFAKDDKFKPSEWFKPAEETEVDGSAFVITPQDNSSAVRLTSYSAEDIDEYDLAENERLIKIETPAYTGKINLTVEFTGEEVYWFGGLICPADSAITLTELDSRTYKVTCVQAFGQPIAITASREDFPNKKDSCVCDYVQRYYFRELFIGFNSFWGDGTIGYAPVSGVGEIMPYTLTMSEQGIHYSVFYNSSAYTIATPAPTNCEGLTFEFTVNEDWISTFGLEDYKFKSYSVNFNNSLSGTLGGFFDKTWFEYGVSENEKTADNFAIALVDATIEMGATEYYDAWLIGVDSSPAYTLTISGLPESSEACHFDVYFDICELSEYVLPLGNIDIDKSELDF